MEMDAERIGESGSMSKGGNRRPKRVSDEKFKENWDRIFKEAPIAGRRTSLRERRSDLVEKPQLRPKSS